MIRTDNETGRPLGFASIVNQLRQTNQNLILMLKQLGYMESHPGWGRELLNDQEKMIWNHYTVMPYGFFIRR